MIDASEIPEPSQSEIIQRVKDGDTHAFYGTVVQRARIMRAWYDAQEYDVTPGNFDKSEIIQRSRIESQKDYDEKLKNFDLLPLEHKFIQTQQRIYDENNVGRTYPEGTKEFWAAKENHFDDCGDDITSFFRDKVLFTKEVEGFGAICIDIASKEGKTLAYKGSAIPYPYIVQAHEIKYYKNWYGHLQLLITAVKNGDDEEWRAFTPKRIYVFKDQNSEPRVINHKFGRTPAYLLKGAVDAKSGFKVGMPRRWNLTGMYKAASELFYDLKKGSKLFGHPIPAMPFSWLKSISGAYDHEKESFDANVINQELGYVVGYEDGEPPNQLFYQADMQGLQHLRSVIFEDLINLIYQIAQVRDKSKVVHNASGRSKQFDSVEEQGLLAQTATDMESAENWTFETMANVRGEKFEDFTITYSKHHDLSSADEIWKQFTEGQQYGGVPETVRTYQVTEYLRKKSAPTETQEILKDEIDKQGFPMSKAELSALEGKIDSTILLLKARPELTRESARSFIQEQLEDAKEMLGETDEEPNEDEPLTNNNE